MGGGTELNWERWYKGQGLSPRGRGNPVNVRPVYLHRRSIPAWAGEPRELLFGTRDVWVYPRVGGGTMFATGLPTYPAGLSPRGRGNRLEPVAQNTQ